MGKRAIASRSEALRLLSMGLKLKIVVTKLIELGTVRATVYKEKLQPRVLKNLNDNH